jgi:hypothetical protein
MIFDEMWCGRYAFRSYPKLVYFISCNTSTEVTQTFEVAASRATLNGSNMILNGKKYAAFIVAN